MSYRVNLRRALLGLLVTFVVSAAVASAQTSYTIDAPVRDTTLGVRGYYDFPITVTNNTSGPLTLYAYRVQNDLPSSEWLTYICTRDLCFPPERNYADPVQTSPGEVVEYHFSVSCGSIPGEVGHFAVGIGDGVNYDTLYFTVTVAQGAGVDDDLPGADRLAVWPSPATDRVTLSGPSAERATFTIFNARGEAVLRGTLDAAAEKTLDVSSLANGTYYVTLPDRPAGPVTTFLIRR